MQLTPPPAAAPTSVAALLAAMSRSPRPALTQYTADAAPSSPAPSPGSASPSVSPDGAPSSPAPSPGPASPSASPDGAASTSASSPMRVELSGKVIAQWAYKCANLLWEEGYAEGDVLTLDVAPSWRAVPWALGAWLQGLTLSTLPAGGAVTVTDRPEEAEGDLVVALTPDPLALSWEGDLPAGVLDGAADVAGQADLPLGPVEPGGSSVALADAGIRFEDLFEVVGVGSAGRVLVEPTSTWDLVRRAVAAWRAGGAVVVVDGLEGAVRERVLAQEGVTDA